MLTIKHKKTKNVLKKKLCQFYIILFNYNYVLTYFPQKLQPGHGTSSGCCMFPYNSRYLDVHNWLLE